MKKGDWAIIISGVALAAILYFSYYQLIDLARASAHHVVIKSEGTVVKTFPLDAKTDETYQFKNAYGTNLIVIKGGLVDVSAADCKNKICVNSESISKVGQSIICLPHRLSVEIVGDDGDQVDEIAY